MTDKVVRRRSTNNNGAKDKVHFNADIEKKYMKMLEELADGDLYRNRTHAVEAAIKLLYEKEKEKKAIEG